MTTSSGTTPASCLAVGRPLERLCKIASRSGCWRYGRLPPDLAARPPDRPKIRSAQEADQRRPSGTECERLASIELPETHDVEPPLVHHRATERLAKDQLPRRRRLQVDHRRQDRQPQLSDEPGGVLEAAQGQVRPVPRLELHLLRT